MRFSICCLPTRETVSNCSFETKANPRLKQLASLYRYLPVSIGGTLQRHECRRAIRPSNSCTDNLTIELKCIAELLKLLKVKLTNQVDRVDQWRCDQRDDRDDEIAVVLVVHILFSGVHILVQFVQVENQTINAEDHQLLKDDLLEQLQHPKAGHLGQMLSERRIFAGRLQFGVFHGVRWTHRLRWWRSLGSLKCLRWTEKVRKGLKHLGNREPRSARSTEGSEAIWV